MAAGHRIPRPRTRRAIGKSAAIITAAIPGPSSAIPAIDVVNSPRRGHSGEHRCRLNVSNSRAKAATSSRQRWTCRTASRRPTRCSRIASPAARTCWRRSASRRRSPRKGIAVLRFDFTGLGASEGDFANTTFSSNVADLVRAADHLRETRQGARDPDRPQPRRRRDPRRRRADPGGQGRRHHRRALRSRPRHRPVQGAHRGHQEAGRGGSLARRPPFTHQARIPRRHRRARPDGAGHERCARRCWSCIRRPTTPSASTMPRTSSSPPSIPRASSRSPAPTIC